MSSWIYINAFQLNAYIYIYMYTYIFREREWQKERERESDRKREREREQTHKCTRWYILSPGISAAIPKIRVGQKWSGHYRGQLQDNTWGRSQRRLYKWSEIRKGIAERPETIQEGGSGGGYTNRESRGPISEGRRVRDNAGVRK